MDSSGGPLPGVTVTLSGVERSHHRSLTLAAISRSRISSPARTRFTLSCPDFQPPLAKATVTEGQTARVSLYLTGWRARGNGYRYRLDAGNEARTSVMRRTWSAASASGVVGACAPAPGLGWPRTPALVDSRFNTEAYDHVDENGAASRGQRPALDVLDRRRHGVVRERAQFLTQGTLPPPARCASRS